MSKTVSLISLLLLFFLNQSIMAQHSFKEYLDKNEVRTDSVEKAAYYREGNRNDKGKLEGEIKVFYKNGTLRKTGMYNDGKRQGEHITYYPNGKIAEKEVFQDNLKTDKYYSWYENGQQKEEGEWAAMGSPLYRVANFWDSTGVQTLTNGTGELMYFSNGKPWLKEIYKDGALIKGRLYREDGEHFAYDTYREMMPEFPGGVQALSKYLSDNVRYPKEARKKGISGKVVISFVVWSNGEIRNAQAIGSKIGYGLEEEAVRVIVNMPIWRPGFQLGKAVAVRYTLPITFGLSYYK